MTAEVLEVGFYGYGATFSQVRAILPMAPSKLSSKAISDGGSVPLIGVADQEVASTVYSGNVF